MMAILKKKNSKYLLAVVINENSAPMVYMEPSTGDYFAIGRVFVSDTDLAKYMDHIRSTNKYSQSSIKMYILNIKEFFRVCKATHNTTKSKGHVKYIMCKIHDEELLELGTIWDSRPN
jgi:hypothetical protein